MADAGESLQYDASWPPKDKERSLHVFTRKEDSLIVDYLIETKQFDRLGGNEVWKTMCRSKRFNPAGRSYQGLRERFLKHIVKRLHSYNRVTPQIKARFLKQNPKALKNINAMKSTKELKRDLATRWSSEDEEEVIGENVPNNCTLTPVLLERKRLVDGLMTHKTLSSTPLERIRDQISSKDVETEESTQRETTVAAVEEFQDSSHLFSSHSAAETTEEDPLNKSQCEMSVQLSHICPSLLFVFERLKALDEHKDVSYTLQLLHDSLRDTLEAHSSTLSMKSLSCLRSSCNGTLTYFGLWEELISYFEKIEVYQLRFDACYVKFFLRVIGEILATPMCCAKSIPELPKFEAPDLYEYLCCEFAQPFRENLISVRKLMKFVRGKDN